MSISCDHIRPSWPAPRKGVSAPVQKLIAFRGNLHPINLSEDIFAPLTGSRTLHGHLLDRNDEARGVVGPSGAAPRRRPTWESHRGILPSPPLPAPGALRASRPPPLSMRRARRHQYPAQLRPCHRLARAAACGADKGRGSKRFFLKTSAPFFSLLKLFPTPPLPHYRPLGSLLSISRRWRAPSRARGAACTAASM